MVTSGYHMPRAMAELGHQLPDMALMPFPVVTEKLRAEPWWASAPTARLILSEYVKYRGRPDAHAHRARRRR